jgi:hypothetical protein
VVDLASRRRAGASRLFRFAWGAAALALVAGMEMVGSLAQQRMGVPQVNHELQPPVGPLAGPNRPMGTYLDALGDASETAARHAAEVQARHASARAARARAEGAHAAVVSPAVGQDSNPGPPAGVSGTEVDP